MNAFMNYNDYNASLDDDDQDYQDYLDAKDAAEHEQPTAGDLTDVIEAGFFSALQDAEDMGSLGVQNIYAAQDAFQAYRQHVAELEAVIEFALELGKMFGYDSQVESHDNDIAKGIAAFAVYRQHVAKLERENEKLRTFVEDTAKEREIVSFEYGAGLAVGFQMTARSLIASLQEAT